MKLSLPAFFLFLTLFCGILPAVQAQNKPNTAPRNRDQSIAFVANKSQWEPQIKYKAELPGGALFLTSSGFTYGYYQREDISRIHDLRYHEHADPATEEQVRCHAYRVHFLGADTTAILNASGKKTFYHNYFLGNDPTHWAGNVPVFDRVTYSNLYPGIDATIYSQETSLKYDFIVGAGADPSLIKLQFEGVEPELLPNGNLLIRTSVNQVEEGAPYVYQQIDGKEIAVKCQYILDAPSNTVRFQFPEGYNIQFPLIIDPVLVFATYSGGTGSTFGFSATYDNFGNLYAGGETFSMGWPVTAGAYQTTFANGVDAALNKYSTDGSALIYSTYFGGSGSDLPNNMVVNNLDELIICGSTTSSDLPTTTGCFDSILGGNTDLYVAHFDAAGSALIGSTYMGGSNVDGSNSYSLSPNGGDVNRGEVYVDASGDIYVGGSTQSADFPVSAGAYQSTSGGAQDGCIFKLNPDCSSLLYSSYLGGSGDDACFSLLLNGAGEIVTIGGTKSSDFPTTASVLHTTLQGGTDGFVTILDLTNGLIASSYLGTTAYDHAFKVQLDELGNVYVMGQTKGNYDVSAGVYSIANGDIFIDKLSPDLSSSLLSTRMGNVQSGFSNFIPTAFLYDDCGNVYLCGYQVTTSLPVTPDAYSTTGGFWLAVLEKDFADLHYATFIPGANHVDGGTSRFDPRGIVYHSVCTADLNFPTSPSVYCPNKLAGGYDCASFKFNFEAMGVHSVAALPPGQKDTVCAPYSMQFDNYSSSPYDITYTWSFNDGTTNSTLSTPTHTFTTPGIYQVVLQAHSDSACITDDYDTLTITVLQTEFPDITTRDTIICSPETAIDLHVTINNPSPNNTILWTPPTGIISGADQATVSVNPSLNTLYQVVVKDTIPGICGFSTTGTVQIDFSPRVLDIVTNDTVVCEGAQVQVAVNASPGYSFTWSPATGVNDSNLLNPIITVNQPETYTLTASHEGCPDTAQTLSIDMHYLPQVSLGPDIEVCQWQPVALQSHVSPFRNDYSYQWTPADGLENAVGPDAEYIADTSGKYVLSVQTPIGCAGSDSVYVTVFPGGFGGISADTGYCPPAQAPLQATGGITYLWDPAYGLDDPTSAKPLARPETSTDYIVYITNEHGCIDTENVSVVVYPLAVITIPDSITVYPGESYHLEPGTNCLYFNWFPTNGINSGQVADPSFSPQVRTRYFVTASTEHGCLTEDSIDILVNPTVLDLPNAFTPGHGENAQFKLSKRGIVRLKSFSIYNRWGNKVFSTTNIDEGWDGSYNGSPQPMGTYIYNIEAVTDSGRPFNQKGNVTLIR